MKRKVVVFVVGHADWGKATTLKALTQGDVRTKQWKIANEWFTLKRRSNDDAAKPPYESTLQFVKRANLHHSLIVALVPNFQNNAYETQKIIDTLKSREYQIHFFVIKLQQSKLGAPAISDKELAILKNNGNGMTMDGYDSPKNIAHALHSYIMTVVKSPPGVP